MNKFLNNSILFLLRHFLSYVSYAVLTFAIMACFAWLLIFDVIFFKGTLTPNFLSVFSFMNPTLGLSSYEAGIEEISHVYVYLSLFVYLLVLLVKASYEYIKKKELTVTFKQRFRYSLVIAGFFHLLALSTLPFGPYDRPEKIGMIAFVGVSFIICIGIIYLHLIIRDLTKIFVPPDY